MGFTDMPPARPTRSRTHARTATEAPPKSERFAVRMTEFQRHLLAEASRARQTTVSQFVLEAATDAAEQVLADRTEFRLSADQWSRFVEALDAPVRPLPRLRHLLESPTVLDEA